MNKKITELISAAEQLIEARQYAAALEHLAAAEAIEPNNKSIHMIRQLIRSLNVEPRPSRLRRFLSATVDPKPATGIAQNGQGAFSDVAKRIRNLTASAEYYLSRGAVDNAFESLMRAYLLDPVAPEVIACEERVLPAWQKLHGTSPADAKREWQMNYEARQPKAGSVFERLKAGKLFH